MSQGSVLASIMFLVYVNDVPEGLNSYMSLFADNTKLLKKTRNHKNCEELQNDINNMCECSKTWETKSNAEKCHVLEMGNGAIRPAWTYKLWQNIISIEKNKKNLGVVI